MKRRSATKRKRLFKNQTAKLGLPPGTPVYVGDRPELKPRVSLIDYDAEQVTEKAIERVSECLPFRQADTVTWVNVDGLNDPAMLEELGTVMGYHTLTLEDILNTEQRPKAEDYGDYLYVTLKMLEFRDEEAGIVTDQLSLIVGRNYVLSIQEAAGDPFDPVRARIRKAVGRIRRSGADFLAYSLLDLVVDSYYVATDKLAERIEALDEAVSAGAARNPLQRLAALKRDLLLLRRAVAPAREVIANLRASESDLIAETTVPYLRDVYDHIVTLTDRVEICRDLLSSIQDVYLALLSNRTNTIMKIVAVFSSVFLPLTFITGIFGMNFEFMPLIHVKWGFAIAVLAMLAISGGMLLYVFRKRWL